MHDPAPGGRRPRQGRRAPATPQCTRRRERLRATIGEVSGDNRNVRISVTLEMSGVRVVSLLLFEGPAPGVILGWTPRGFGAISLLAGGRVGLRRGATRAPAGRLYASAAAQNVMPG